MYNFTLPHKSPANGKNNLHKWLKIYNSSKNKTSNLIIKWNFHAPQLNVDNCQQRITQESLSA
jgi:hypothetical protein